MEQGELLAKQQRGRGRVSERKPDGMWLCRDGSMEVWEDGELVYAVSSVLPDPFIEEAIASAELAEEGGGE